MSPVVLSGIRNFVVGKRIFHSLILKNNSIHFPSREASGCNLHSCRAFSTTICNSLDIGGVFPPIPTPFVHREDSSPGNEVDEDVDWSSLSSNVAKWMRIPFAGFVVEGSTGEVAYLTHDERIRIVKTVRDCVPSESGKLVIAGAGCESTRATIEMCSKMAEAGADAVLVITPSFYKRGMSDAALRSHFTRVADSSPVPVILYSVPANTGIDLSPEVAIELASHPNVAGMKDSGGDVAKAAFIINKTKRAENFQFLSGTASSLLPTLIAGGAGGICALANALGPEVCQLHSLFKEGRLSEAAELQRRLVEPNEAVTKRFGVAGLKRALEWQRFVGGRPRTPLQPLNKEQEHYLRKAFLNNGFYAGKFR